MSMKEASNQAVTGSDDAAALSDAIRRVRQEARSVADAAGLIITEGEQPSSNARGQVATLQAKVADFQGVAADLDSLLTRKQAHERQLAAQLDVLRQADSEHAGERQRLRQRLHATQEALRHANAALQGVRQVYKLLRQETLKVTDSIRVPMLQEENHRKYFEAEWFAFLESGRLSASVDTERALREPGDEPLQPVSAPVISQH